jgi:hypothetical protein
MYGGACGKFVGGRTRHDNLCAFQVRGTRNEHICMLSHSFADGHWTTTSQRDTGLKRVRKEANGSGDLAGGWVIELLYDFIDNIR